MLKLSAVAGALLIVIYMVFPKVFTGDYADLTLESITATPEGKVTLRVAWVASSGTPVYIQLFKDRKYAGGTRSAASSVFPRRATHGMSVVSFDLNPERAAAAGRFEDSLLFRRLLVHAGQTHHLYGDQVLKLFDFKAADGARYTGFVRVNASLSAI